MTPEKQKRWLDEHVPHRVRACLTGIPLLDELTRARDDESRAEVQLRCLGNAAWEGRMAGMRWLIEFVGVVDSGGKPVRPNRRAADVSIVQIAGGREIDLGSPDAVVLSKVWKGCSQASGHPTQDSNHPPVDEMSLDAAMRIIVAHLQATIYAAASRRLTDEALTA